MQCDNHQPFARESGRYWFIYTDNGVLLKRDAQGVPHVPLLAEPPVPPEGLLHPLGGLNGVECVACRIDGMPESPEWMLADVRTCYTALPVLFHENIGRGFQLTHWDTHSRYCSRCGAACVPDSPISKRCPECSEVFFPQISMAVLVLVHKTDSILLVHAHNFKGPYYSCIAGYVEAGETLEQCVSREVMEETGITVDTIRYFDSQPWPFPSLLMAGFTARFHSGELVLQESELGSGAFFHRDALPDLPPDFTLARHMIDAWSEGRVSDEEPVTAGVPGHNQ